MQHLSWSGLWEWLTRCPWSCWALSGEMCCQCSASLLSSNCRLVCSSRRCPGVITLIWKALSSSSRALFGELCGAKWPFWGPGVLWDAPFLTQLHRCCSMRAELQHLVLQWVCLFSASECLCLRESLNSIYYLGITFPGAAQLPVQNQRISCAISAIQHWR